VRRGTGRCHRSRPGWLRHGDRGEDPRFGRGARTPHAPEQQVAPIWTENRCVFDCERDEIRTRLTARATRQNGTFEPLLCRFPLFSIKSAAVASRPGPAFACGDAGRASRAARPGARTTRPRRRIPLSGSASHGQGTGASGGGAQAPGTLRVPCTVDPGRPRRNLAPGQGRSDVGCSTLTRGQNPPSRVGGSTAYGTPEPGCRWPGLGVG